MKHAFLKILLVCATLAVMFSAAAMAEEDMHQLDLDLFTAGRFPEGMMIQTFSTVDAGDYILEQLRLQAAEIKLGEYELTPDALKLLLEDVINSNPDLFYVGTSFQIYTYSSSGLVSRILPTYVYTGDDLDARIASFNQTVSSIADYASDATTQIGKMLLVNDYFCVNFEYDTDYNNYRPDLLFNEKKGVCQAYMLAYAAVMDELGIGNTHASSSSMNHTWNVVELNGSWYHIDTTWNDPTADMPMRACHNNFLLSDAGITASGHSGWNCAASCDSTAYDSAFWMNIKTPLGVMGDTIYYLDPGVPNGMRTIHSWKSGATADVHSYSIVNLNGGYSYYSDYDPICAGYNTIYYGVRNYLLSVDFNGENPNLVYMADENMHIYACWRNGSTISMLVGEDLNGTLSVLTCADDQILYLPADPALAEICVGENVKLVPADASSPSAAQTITWTQETIDESSIVAVDESGFVTGTAPGVARVIGAYPDGIKSCGNVIVHSNAPLTLPADLDKIESEAFIHIAAQEVVLPDGIKTICANAFAGSEQLLLMNIPESVTKIEDDAFSNCPHITLLVYENSEGLRYAQDNHTAYIILNPSA